jgi:hypothetical protein
MTTTELINLLKKVEFGGSGRSREITIWTGEDYTTAVLSENQELVISSTGDGICGAELDLHIRASD